MFLLSKLLQVFLLFESSVLNLKDKQDIPLCIPRGEEAFITVN